MTMEVYSESFRINSVALTEVPFFTNEKLLEAFFC